MMSRRRPLRAIPLLAALIAVATGALRGAEPDAPATNAPPSAASAASATNAAPAVASAPATPANEAPAPAATNAPARGSYDWFKPIGDRNIFNPGRSARTARGERAETAPKKTPKVDTLSLVGVMSYGKGDLAFFEGSSSEYRKVARVGDQVGGHRVLEIGPSVVQIATEGRTNRISVGGGMRREDDGGWQVVESGLRPAGETAKAAAGPADSGAGGDESDILKKLMQKREQELNNEKK